MKSYFRYWGKAKKPLEVDYCANILGDDEVAGKHHITTQDLKEKVRKNKWTKVVKGGSYVSYHLLADHSLDVAAVADQWWKNSVGIRRGFIHATGLSEEQVYAWVMFFIGLHDLGRLDIRFQMKSPQTVEQLQTDVFAALKPIDNHYDHGSYGYKWCVWEINDYGFDYLTEDDALPWMRQVAEHHGKIPECDEPQAPAFVSNEVRQQDKQARAQWIQALNQLFLHRSEQSLSDVSQTMPSMLAGFCSVCDWIGSSKYFPYQNAVDETLSTEQNLNSYFASRGEIAEQALNAFGVLSQKVKQCLSGSHPRGLDFEQGIKPYIDWFDLFHAETPFMQIKEFNAEETTPIQKLFLGLPAGNNHAFFNEVGEVKVSDPSDIAITLFNQNSNAPGFSGKQKAGLRGPTPINTLIKRETLRKTVWVNVLHHEFINQLYPAGNNKPVWVDPIIEPDKLENYIKKHQTKKEGKGSKTVICPRDRICSRTILVAGVN